MKRCLFIALISFCLLSNQTEARRIATTRYYLEECYIVGTEISSIRIDSSYTFSFPVSVSAHHVSAYLWLRQLVDSGNLPLDLPLIYLDAHLDYIAADSSVVQSSNWVRYILQDGLSSKAICVLPEWLFENPYFAIYLYKIDDTIGKARSHHGYDLQLLAGLASLSSEELKRPVFLSIDCDFFSSMGYPDHKPTLEEIDRRIDDLISVLKDSGIQIAALNISISPGYTWHDQSHYIKRRLLEAFAEYENL